MLYSGYFIVSGYGESDTSALNAFDSALVDAKIAQCNLVRVSSIIPEDAVEKDIQDIPSGQITHCVMARKDGVKDETVSAGVGVARLTDYGIVAEDMGSEDVNESLKHKLDEMGKARNQTPEDMKYETVTRKVDKKHGCAIAALIYCD